MAPFPLNMNAVFGHEGSLLVYLLIGFGFGAVLEMSGFAISTRLAAQFYLKDMTVLKVMFTGIVVAMLLVFGASAVGLLDYNLVWVNPTYLVPGIVGGLIMGAGFILGGFCPGTSVVSAATGKLDGLLFVVGALFGMFLFGETVGLYEPFWNSTAMGRFTLPELFGVEPGVVVLGVVLMALAAFAFAEFSEKIFGGRGIGRAPRWRFGAAGGLVALGVGVLLIGQPTLTDKWQSLSPQKEALLQERSVQIEPAELRSLMYQDHLNLVMLDVRSEQDYNLFHLLDARHVPAAELPAALDALRTEPANTVFVVISNDETAATAAWKVLLAGSVPNVYLLGGGINQWLATFADEAFLAEHPPISGGEDTLRYAFSAALGSRYAAAYPHAETPELAFTPKVKLEGARGGSSGGCG